MESRGPHEAGAPADSMDAIAIPDKSSSTSDALDNWHGTNSVAKNNNRLLFFTVSLIKAYCVKYSCIVKYDFFYFYFSY